MLSSRFLFLTLKTFSATGGIEKVCRVAGRAMHQLTNEVGGEFRMFSLYDKSQGDLADKYFPAAAFRGFGNNKPVFINAALKHARRTDTVILSHINLLTVGWMMKRLSPSVRLVLFAHGIEIWKPLSLLKRKMLLRCDAIFCVSEYTRQQVHRVNHIPLAKLKVLNNGLDPFLPGADEVPKDKALLDKYGIGENDPVLFTLTRLAKTERFKGYDKIIQLLPSLKQQFPGIKYLIAGKYTADERDYIHGLAQKLSVENEVILAGFIADEDLAKYFNLASLYISPSKKEGFGIVFIEAMFYRLPVIAGNTDGSVDALAQGKLGTLVDPDDLPAIEAAITKVLSSPEKYQPKRSLLADKFSYYSYMQAIGRLLDANPLARLKRMKRLSPNKKDRFL